MKKESLIVFMMILTFLLQPALFPQDSDKDLEKKKLEIEVSGGAAFIHAHEQFYNRVRGTYSLIDQYAHYYQNSASLSGDDLQQMKILMPLNLSLNYAFSRNWFLKIGFEYSSGKAFTAQQYTIDWNGKEETYDYDYSYRLSSLMPFIGVGYRFSSFGIYTVVGYNITDFSFTQVLKYEEDGDVLLEEGDFYDTGGRSLAVILGGKYMIRCGRKAKLLLKMEYLYLKIGSFTGNKTNGSGTTAGTLYSYEQNPYNMDWIPYWDLYGSESEPEKMGFRNIKRLGLDLSCARLLIGFSF
jgi:hypothetical protein